jgi:hypothetical protein
MISENHEYQPAGHHRSHKMVFFHGSPEEAFQDLPNSHIDDCIADSPDSPAHQPHTDKPRYQKVDVTTAGFGNRRLLRSPPDPSARPRALQDIIDRILRTDAAGASLIQQEMILPG